MIPTTQTYVASAWFWVVAGDESRAWSSADGAYVNKWPSDMCTRVGSEDAINEVLYAAGLWHLAPRAVPPAVTAAQGKLALYAAGLLEAADTAAQAAGGSVLIYWREWQTWDRRHPLISAIGAAIGLDADGIDALFVDADGY